MTRNFARKSILTLIILSMIAIGPMAMAANYASLGGTELPASATPMPTPEPPAPADFSDLIDALLQLHFLFWR